MRRDTEVARHLAREARHHLAGLQTLVEAPHDAIVIDVQQCIGATLRPRGREKHGVYGPGGTFEIDGAREHDRRNAAGRENADEQGLVIARNDVIEAAVGQDDVETDRCGASRRRSLHELREVRVPERERLGEPLRGLLVEADDHHVARDRSRPPRAQRRELGAQHGAIDRFQRVRCHQCEGNERDADIPHDGRADRHFMSFR